MRKRIAVIHFQPLELYPPVMNLLTYLQKNFPEAQVDVYTNHTDKEGFNPFTLPGDNIRIRRLAGLRQKSSSYTRYWGYFQFYWRCFWGLVFGKPEKLLYFETLSSGPAFLYKKLV